MKQTLPREQQQTRTHSLIEAITNTVVGYLLALLIQIVLFPVYGLHISVEDGAALAGVFTVASIIRSYVLRRVFNSIS